MNLITSIVFAACLVTTFYDLQAHAFNFKGHFIGPFRSISARNRCPLLSGSLKNGWVRSVERTAYFKCFQSYTLIGPSNLTCHHSGWSEPTPVCAGKLIICSAYL